jgi:TRAP-type C4-dicarboxylate transport system permease small subunit
MKMRNLFLFILIFFLAGTAGLRAQCSICTRTAQQMGERPAKALNSGIIYLAVTPLAIFGLLGYRWWKSNQTEEETK